MLLIYISYPLKGVKIFGDGVSKDIDGILISELLFHNWFVNYDDVFRGMIQCVIVG